MKKKLALTAALAALVLAPLVHAAPGDLDPSFGGTGTVVSPSTAFSNDGASSVVIQSDGKILIAVTVTAVIDGSPAGGYLLRFNPDGSIDDGFSSAGIANSLARLALQSDGRILVTGSDLHGDASATLARLNADGTFDSSFGNGGVVSSAAANVLAVQEDGKILVAGLSDGAFAVARINADGTSDATFGSGGRVISDLTSDVDVPSSIALQSDGKIVVAGSSGAGGSDPNFAIVRYRADGTLDASFGSGGVMIVDFGATSESAESMAVQGDGKIVVAGAVLVGSDFKIALVRCNADGALDATFGSGGKVTTSFGGDGFDDAASVAIESDGKIVVGGTSTAAGHNAFLVARYTTTGALDASFGAGGRTTTDFGSTAAAVAMALQSDGKIVLAGQLNNFRSAVARYIAFPPAGTLDPSFAIGGKTTLGFGIGDDVAQGVALQGDGKIVVAGLADTGAGLAFALARYTAGGALDSTFGSAGKLTTTIGAGGNDQANAVAVQNDQKIVVAGFSSNGTNGDFALVRYEPGGTLDASFGSGGKVITDFASGDELASSLAIQSDGKIVLAGYSLHAGSIDIALARYNADGTLDAGFGSGGKVITDFGGNFDLALAIALQSDGKIIVAGQTHNGANFDFALVRYHADGTLDTGFGNGGKVITAIGSGNDSAHGVLVQSDGRIVAAGSAFNGSNDDFALVRYNADGTLDGTFGSGGKVTTPIGSGSDSGASVALQRNEKLVVAGSSFNGSDNDFAVVRYQRDGTLDSTFGSGGKVSTPIGTAGDEATSLTLQSDGEIVVAGRSFNGSDDDFALARYPGDFDVTTLPPALVTPASGTANKAPVSVVFNLPEQASAGSVTIGFGPANQTLVLAVSQESAGVHAFSFDPADPVASSGGAVVSIANDAIADGIYDVTLSYRDACGNPAATATRTNVAIDTTAPNIGPPPGGFSPRIVYAGTVAADYATSASISDLTAVIVTQTPPATAVLAAGTTNVTLTATDAAGNVATLSFELKVRADPPRSSVPFAKDDPVPDAGNFDGLPGDATFTSFGVPAIDDDGNLAFTAKWTSDPIKRGSGLFSSHDCLALAGGDVPGISGATFKSFADPVIHAGNVACIAAITGSVKGSVLLFGPATGPLLVCAQTGLEQAEVDGAKIKSFVGVEITDNGFGFLARLAPGTGNPKVTVATDLTLWVKDGIQPLTVVLREGPQPSGRAIKTIAAFMGGNGSPGQGRGWVRQPNEARMLALVTYDDKTHTVVEAGQSGVTSLTDKAPSGAGESFASFSVPAANANGNVVFAGSLAVGGSVTKANAHRIFADFGDPTFTTIVSVTDEPGTHAGQIVGAKFTVLKDPVLSGDGGLAFPATVKGGNATGLRMATLWWQPSGGSLSLLAEGGDDARDLAGAKWKAFTSVAIAANRGPIFSATLVPNNTNVTKASASGVWACDFNGDPRLLFRTGVAGAIVPGKTLKSFALLKARVGSVGVTRSFNAAQQVAWLATFKEDNSQAIVVTEVP